MGVCQAGVCSAMMSNSSALSARSRAELRLPDPGTREDQPPSLPSSPLPAWQLMLTGRIQSSGPELPAPPCPVLCPGSIVCRKEGQSCRGENPNRPQLSTKQLTFVLCNCFCRRQITVGSVPPEAPGAGWRQRHGAAELHRGTGLGAKLSCYAECATAGDEDPRWPFPPLYEALHFRTHSWTGTHPSRALPLPVRLFHGWADPEVPGQRKCSSHESPGATSHPPRGDHHGWMPEVGRPETLQCNPAGEGTRSETKGSAGALPP